MELYEYFLSMGYGFLLPDSETLTALKNKDEVKEIFEHIQKENSMYCFEASANIVDSIPTIENPFIKAEMVKLISSTLDDMVSSKKFSFDDFYDMVPKQERVLDVYSEDFKDNIIKETTEIFKGIQKEKCVKS